MVEPIAQNKENKEPEMAAAMPLPADKNSTQKNVTPHVSHEHKKAKKTPGEKSFGFLTHVFIGIGLNYLGSIFITYWLKGTERGKKIEGMWAKQLPKISKEARAQSTEVVAERAAHAVELFYMYASGWITSVLMILPLEFFKDKVVGGIDKVWNAITGKGKGDKEASQAEDGNKQQKEPAEKRSLPRFLKLLGAIAGMRTMMMIVISTIDHKEKDIFGTGVATFMTKNAHWVHDKFAGSKVKFFQNFPKRFVGFFGHARTDIKEILADPASTRYHFGEQGRLAQKEFTYTVIMASCIAVATFLMNKLGIKKKKPSKHPIEEATPSDPLSLPVVLDSDVSEKENMVSSEKSEKRSAGFNKIESYTQAAQAQKEVNATPNAGMGV